jgi:hypothetical protein
MNIFRILADFSHAASKITLMVAIHRNSSAEGVSLLTQLLYALVFCARYLDHLCGLFDDARVSTDKRKGGRMEDNDLDIGSLRG